MTSGFVGMNVDQARKVSKHLGGVGDMLQGLLKDLFGTFGNLQWTGRDGETFGRDLKDFGRQVGMQAVEAANRSVELNRRADQQESTSA